MVNTSAVNMVKKVAWNYNKMQLLKGINSLHNNCQIKQIYDEMRHQLSHFI